MENNVVDFGKARTARLKDKGFPVADRLEYLGIRMFDMPALPPMVILFELFNRYDEVPLPDGHAYQMKNSELRIKLGGTWQKTEKSVNELTILVAGLSGEQWQKIKSSCRRSNMIYLSKGFEIVD